MNFKQQLVNLARREPNIEMLFDVLLKAQALLGKLSVLVVRKFEPGPFCYWLNMGLSFLNVLRGTD